MHQNLSEDLDIKLGQFSLDNIKAGQLSFDKNRVDEDWAAFKDVVFNTALTHLDKNTHKYHDWFDDNHEDVQKLLEEKQEAFRSYQQDTSISKKVAYSSTRRTVQTRRRDMKDSGVNRKANEIH